MDDPSSLARLIRQTVRRDPVSWAAACGIRLRPYQRQVALAVAHSVIHRLGLTFVVIFPRQSGKNEVQAHLLAWALFRSAPHAGRLVSVSPTFKPQAANAMDRLRRSLDSCLATRARWRLSRGQIFTCGGGSLQFFSADPATHVVGATANILLNVDEAQEIDPLKFDKDFDPMTASTNATRVFWGTAWTSDTLLDRQRRLALLEQEQDGIQRFFFATADDIRLVVPAYGLHLDRVIAERGRNHPLVRTQYFGETIDAQSGMFNPARLGLIFNPSRLSPPPSPACNAGTAFLVDVAGMDESKKDLESTLRSAGLSNPVRDSTTLTVVAVDLSSLPDLERPSYRVLARHVWTGENHLTVFGALKNLVEKWHPTRIVVDATGVGEGLWAMLDHRFSPRVIPVKFTSSEKSEIGWRFLSIVETGRFVDPSPSDQVRLQYERCLSEILPGPEKTLRWGVPQGARAPDGSLVHDDFVLADSLVAVLDRLDWQVHVRSVFLSPRDDPLDSLSHF